MTSDATEVALNDFPGEFTATGWIAPLSGLTPEQAEQLIDVIDRRIDYHEVQATMGSWWLADILCWSEDNLGDAFSQITPDPSKNRRSYLALMRIARDFPDGERRYPPDVMSIWKHGEVYNLEPYVQDELLEAFAEGELNGTELRKEAQKLRDQQSLGSRDEPVVEHKPEVCPLCSGVGEVSQKTREDFLRFMAERGATA